MIEEIDMKNMINMINTITIEIEKMIDISTPLKENTKDNQDRFLTRLQRAATEKEEIIRKKRTGIEGAQEVDCDV